MTLLIVATVAWLVFAWAMLSWIGFFLQGSSLSDLSFGETAACVFAFVVGPLTLVVWWSFTLQGRLPTRNQMRKVALAAIILAVFVALAIPIAFGVGWLYNATFEGPGG